MYRRVARLICVSIFLGVAASGSAVAQTTSGIAGTIRDETGSVLPGVAVTIRPAAAGPAAPTVVSNQRGEYEVRALAPGQYRIEIVLPGFRTQTIDATLVAGQTRALDIVLQLAPLAETVTVTRTAQDYSTVPNAIAVIGQEEIQFAQRQVSPAEVLVAIPGLAAENGQNFSIRGGVRLVIRAPLSANMRSVQIIQDGVPLTTADGTTQPNNIDLGSEGRIEVLRGPSSVLYGNAAAGVIDLQTELPPAGRFVLQPDIQFGSYGYERLQVKAAGTAGKVGYLFNVNRMKTDGFRQHSAAEVRKVNMMVRAAISPATEIRGVFNFYDMPFGESPSTLALADALDHPRSVRQDAIDQGWGESGRQGQGGVTFEHQFGGGQIFRATGWALWRDVWNPIPSRIIGLGRTAAGFRSEWGGERRLGSLPFSWIAGVDVSAQRDDRKDFGNAGVLPGGSRTQEGPLSLSQNENVLSTAPFIQATLTIRPRLRATVGARYDAYTFKAIDRFLSDGDQSGDRRMHAASPKLGIVYAATDALNFYANYATAYQTPLTQELANRPPGQGGGFNQDLQPANLRSVEGGARGLLERWHLRYELVGYRSALKNAFVPFQRPDSRSYYLNAAESSRSGVEALLEWMPVTRVRTRLAYTYQDFTFARFVTGGVDYSGKREPGTPPHQVSAQGIYLAPFGLQSTAQVRWMDAYAVNNANTFSNWSYTVVDLRFGFTHKRERVSVRPFVGIDNLLNKRYNAATSPNAFGNRFYDPAPGRTFYVGMTIAAGRL